MILKLKLILKNGGLFLILILLALYYAARETDFAELAAAAASADVFYLMAGVFAMCLFLFCEGCNLIRCLHFSGHKELNFASGMKYAATGFFGSSVTPSATGGQPLQLYFMYRDGVSISEGMPALLLELLSFQMITVLLAAAGYWYQKDLIAETLGSLQPLFLFGVMLNGALMILLLLALFSAKTVGRLLDFVVKSVRVVNPAWAEKLRVKLQTQLGEYKQCAGKLKDNRIILVKTAATTLIQILAMYAVPYFVYKSFGLSTHGIVEVVALQAVLFVSVSSLPLPGALGVSESAFLLLFRTFFPTELLPAAVVLSRGVSFYLMVLVTGLVTAVSTVSRKGKQHGIYHFNCRRRQRYCRSSETVSGKQRISDSCSI